MEAKQLLPDEKRDMRKEKTKPPDDAAHYLSKRIARRPGNFSRKGAVYIFRRASGNSSTNVISQISGNLRDVIPWCHAMEWGPL
jgi:hypothetical protein